MGEQLEKKLKEEHRTVESMKQAAEKLGQEIEDLKQAQKEEEERRKAIHEENMRFNQDLKQKAEDIKNSTQERDKAQKAYDALKRKAILDEDERRELELSRAVLRSDTENLIREIEQLRHQVESDSKTIADI